MDAEDARRGIQNAMGVGFRAGRAGLYVPNGHDDRTREVVSKDATKALHRAIQQILGPHAMRVAFTCTKDGCPSPAIQKIKTLGGGFILQCGCTNRMCGGKW